MNHNISQFVVRNVDIKVVWNKGNGSGGIHDKLRHLEDSHITEKEMV